MPSEAHAKGNYATLGPPYQSGAGQAAQWAIPALLPFTLSLAPPVTPAPPQAQLEAEEEQAMGELEAELAAEVQELQRRLADACKSSTNLEMQNKRLQAEVESARSQLPAKDVAYENLKESFFRMQARWQKAECELHAALSAVEGLRARAEAAEAALAATAGARSS